MVHSTQRGLHALPSMTTRVLNQMKLHWALIVSVSQLHTCTQTDSEEQASPSPRRSIAATILLTFWISFIIAGIRSVRTIADRLVGSRPRKFVVVPVNNQDVGPSVPQTPEEAFPNGTQRQSSTAATPTTNGLMQDTHPACHTPLVKQRLAEVKSKGGELFAPQTADQDSTKLLLRLSSTPSTLTTHASPIQGVGWFRLASTGVRGAG